jgi:hypothetical protein
LFSFRIVFIRSRTADGGLRTFFTPAGGTDAGGADAGGADAGGADAGGSFVFRFFLAIGDVARSSLVAMIAAGDSLFKYTDIMAAAVATSAMPLLSTPIGMIISILPRVEKKLLCEPIPE